MKRRKFVKSLAALPAISGMVYLRGEAESKRRPEAQLSMPATNSKRNLSVAELARLHMTGESDLEEARELTLNLG